MDFSTLDSILPKKTLLCNHFTILSNRIICILSKFNREIRGFLRYFMCTFFMCSQNSIDEETQGKTIRRNQARQCCITIYN